VASVFLAVYVVVFTLRFFLLERLFARLPHHHHADPAPTEGSR
jgi:hypothetical protein